MIIQFKAQIASCDMAEGPTREAILEAAELTMPDVFREADSGGHRSALEGRIVRAFREGQAKATDHSASVRPALTTFAERVKSGRYQEPKRASWRRRRPNR